MDKKLTALIATMSLSAALVVPASAYGTLGDTTTGGAPVRGNMANNPIERMTNNLDRDLSTNGYSGNGYRMNVPNTNTGTNMLNDGPNMFNGTNNNGMNPNMNTNRNTMRSNSLNNRTTTRDYNTTGTGNYRTNTVRARAVTGTGSNWGWLGLLGLFGLAGMRRRESDRA